MSNKPQQNTDVEANIKFLIGYAPFKVDTTDKIVQEIGLFYLPYSVGFEIECDMNPDFTLDDVQMEFRKIPNILHSDVNDGHEQRFRIPKGIDGLVCLFYIAEKMRKYAFPNRWSGIHYHVDCSECYDSFSAEFIKKHSNYVLSELDTWNYKGTYNARACYFSESRNWTRFKSSTKTMEFRIGEMTFDYALLSKRILHCCEIVRTIKADLIPIIQRYSKDNVDIINNRKIQI